MSPCGLGKSIDGTESDAKDGVGLSIECTGGESSHCSVDLPLGTASGRRERAPSSYSAASNGSFESPSGHHYESSTPLAAVWLLSIDEGAERAQQHRIAVGARKCANVVPCVPLG